MKRYIDTERVKAEIERLKDLLIRGACASQIEMETNCKDEAYNEVLSIITSLEQEQSKDIAAINQERSKVDLDESIKDFLLNNSEFLVERDSKAVVQKLARHFYELGLKARKEERK